MGLESLEESTWLPVSWDGDFVGMNLELHPGVRRGR